MTSFTNQLQSAQIEGSSVALELPPGWLQGRTAYGGWQAALAVRAMRTVVGDDLPLRSLQANFVAPIPPGTIIAQAELLRSGKSVAQVEARIFVGGKVAFTCLGIFGSSRQSSITKQAQTLAIGTKPDELPDSPYIEGVKPVFTRNFHQRWATGFPPYSGATNADAQIYVRLRDDAVKTEAHLVCLADAIPPSAISMLTSPAMLSSINWTLELTSTLDDEERDGWFRFDTTLTAASDGYAWQSTEIWSEKGKLVALSRQCVAVFEKAL